MLQPESGALGLGYFSNERIRRALMIGMVHGGSIGMEGEYARRLLVGK